MIKFFDIKTGEVFDGEYPYIHWTEPISVGVIRYKSIHILSDEPKLTISLPSEPDWQFALCNINIDSDVKGFSDLEKYIVNEIEESEGTEIDGLYAHQFFIVCRSEVEGEFIENFKINGVEFRVGAEFWGENESLQINLANQGTEIPSSVGRAIYGSDVYEEDPDWVLLNRKFKELLVSHMDVMDNKGSYKSLENALAWFEYGDQVEMREVWKYHTPAGTKYYDTPIAKMVTEELKQRFFNSSKTTSFTLRNLKRIFDNHDDELPKYNNRRYVEGDTRIIDADKLACMWSEDEMRLKMVLLCNFLETYFMPIHTEIVRSTVEDIHNFIIRKGYKTADNVHEECFTNCNDFILNWGDTGGDDDGDDDVGDDSNDGGKPNPIDPDDPTISQTYRLGEVHVYAGVPSESPYYNAFEMKVKTDADLNKIIACHYITPGDYNRGRRWKKTPAQVFNGIGAVVKCNLKFPELVKSGKLQSNQWNEFITTTFEEDEPNWSENFSVNIFFPYPGTFTFNFEFKGAETGKIYSKQSTITIEDNLAVDLEFYRIEPVGNDLPDPFTTPTDLKYMFKYGKYDPDEKTGRDFYKRYVNSNIDGGIRLMNMRTVIWPDGSLEDAKGFIAETLGKCFYEYCEGRSFDIIEKSYKTQGSYVRYCPKEWDGSLPAAPENTITFDSEVFFPELHKLVSVTGDVPVGALVVCRPIIDVVNDKPKRLPYSNLAGSTNPYWEFYSWNKLRNISELSDAMQDAIIGWESHKDIPVGRYTATFRYRLGTEDRVITKDAPFKFIKK